MCAGSPGWGIKFIKINLRHSIHSDDSAGSNSSDPCLVKAAQFSLVNLFNSPLNGKSEI